MNIAKQTLNHYQKTNTQKKQDTPSLLSLKGGLYSPLPPLAALYSLLSLFASLEAQRKETMQKALTTKKKESKVEGGGYA